MGIFDCLLRQFPSGKCPFPPPDQVRGRLWSRRGGINLRVFLCGVPMYASAQTLDFLHLSVRRWAIWKWRDAKLYAPPFGAALGNLEVAGRQTVRAPAKNAFFPNWKLLASHPGFPDGHYASKERQIFLQSRDCSDIRTSKVELKTRNPYLKPGRSVVSSLSGRRWFPYGVRDKGCGFDIYPLKPGYHLGPTPSPNP
jgi:hypothetical protein